MVIRRFFKPLLILSMLMVFELHSHALSVVATDQQLDCDTETVEFTELSIADETEKSVEALLAGGLSHPIASNLLLPEKQLLCSIGPEIHAEESIETVQKALPSPITASQPEGKFHGIILKAANRHQVDPALIKAVIKAESGYNDRAVSKKGAMGLMQLMPSTARALGVIDSLDPEHNINGGAKYLRQLLDRFDGDVRLALAAYNAGSKRVRQYRGVPPFKATRFFIKKVFSYYQMYKKQMDKPFGSV